MADTILIKRSTTPGSIPTTSSLVVGELAMNVPDGKVFFKQSGSSIGEAVRSLVTLDAAMVGNLILTGSITATSGFTGSVQGNASTATTASYATMAATASFISGNISFPNGLDVTGSLVVTGGITGSISGSIANATTASFAVTASYAMNGGGSGVSSSFATTASYATMAATASYYSGNVAFPNGLDVTGSLTATGGFTGSVQGNASTATTASFAVTASYAMNGGGSGVSSSFATTASYAETVSGYISFPNGLDVTGSLVVTGGITGSISGSIANATTASYATTSSFAVTASYAMNGGGSGVSSSFATTASYAETVSGYISFPNGLDVTGSLVVTGGITGSISGSIQNATTASYANTAQNLTNVSITFSTALNPNYSRITSGSQHLTDGTYVVSGMLNDGVYVNYRISGMFSWYTGSVTQDSQDEIFLHRTGRSSSTASLFMRTTAVNGVNTFLEIGSDYPVPSGSYQLTFVKLA